VLEAAAPAGFFPMFTPDGGDVVSGCEDGYAPRTGMT
jgi:hypothetical protein